MYAPRVNGLGVGMGQGVHFFSDFLLLCLVETINNQ